MLILQTFISGLQDVIRDVLSAQGARRIQHMLDGAVVYAHDRPVDAGCFTNTFEVLLDRQLSGPGALDQLMADALNAHGALPLRPLRGGARTFRIVCSLESRLTAVDSRRKAALEQLIARRTGLAPERGGADVEFWLYGRSEGRCFLLRRLSYHRVTEKQLQRGELRPELCWCLNWLSRPAPDDVFLDPFAGSGAIPAARLAMGRIARLYALDIDPAKAAALRRRLGAGRVFTAAVDVRALGTAVPAQTVTKVVTDPPWGYYEDIDVPALYADLFDPLLTACAPGAVLVLLAARADEMERAIAARPMLRLDAIYRILVNGKKAAIYVASIPRET